MKKNKKEGLDVTVYTMQQSIARSSTFELTVPPLPEMDVSAAQDQSVHVPRDRKNEATDLLTL